MKLTVDPEADALYLRLNDAQDNVVGVEMLHLSKRARKADLRRLLFETLGTSAPQEFLVRETPSGYGNKNSDEK